MNYERKRDLLQSNLKIIIKILNLTLEQFGDFCGVTKQTVSNWCNNKVQMQKQSYIAVMYTIMYYIKANVFDKHRIDFIETLLEIEDITDYGLIENIVFD